jgi:class 3 adenylate cyclase
MSGFTSRKANPVTRRLTQATTAAQIPSNDAPTLSRKADCYAPATVLFVDMVGFTEFCARNNPGTVIAMLRELLALLGQEVLAHGGSVEKFLGDGLMAVFRKRAPRSREATDAVSCAISMTEAVAAWNGRAGRTGDEAIRIAVGIHTGGVIIGEVGNASQGEVAVLGDTVNIASRVEGKCRCLNASILVTLKVMEKVGAEGGRDVVKRFANFGFQELRGRSGYIHLHGRRR